MGDSKYELSDEELARIDHTFPGEWHGNTGTSGTHVKSPTREEWNDLSEEEQRTLYYKYSYGADAGKWDDPKNALPRTQEPERAEWKVQAKDGYDVDPGELRKLAKDMKYKLDIWKRKLNAVGATAITAADLGNTKGSDKFVEVANASRSGFQEYITAIETAYNGVISKLKATADQYENAHENTNNRVNATNPSGGAPNLM